MVFKLGILFLDFWISLFHLMRIRTNCYVKIAKKKAKYMNSFK